MTIFASNNCDLFFLDLNSPLFCRHPAYSINGILGIPQPPTASDANDNLLKRKRDDDEDTRGEEVPSKHCDCSSHNHSPGERGGGVQASTDAVHELVLAAGERLGGRQVGERSGGRLEVA